MPYWGVQRATATPRGACPVCGRSGGLPVVTPKVGAMPDDADFERPVRGSRWSDSQSRAALQAIAEGVAEIAGFDLVGISAARDDGYLHTLCVVGPEEACAALADSLAPTQPLLDQLEVADDWGALKFVPHDR